MKNDKRLDWSDAAPATEKSIPCHSHFESGICSDCHYYSTWQGDGWCEQFGHRIEHSEREKDCYVS
ncbi:MAG: hypothetical protein ACI4WX_01585 [Aristaeellaceae bacterium]